MQDSLEEYLKLSKNCVEATKDSCKDIPKEVLISVQLKKESEDKALKIVEILIDGKLRPQIFLKSLYYINPNYYQDIVEERAITKICGYPLCGKKIPSMPTKQYSISTKQNKIYDITERKNYCSNFCCQASGHIQNQIDSSPLWARNYGNMQQYNLLTKPDKIMIGKEIDQGLLKPDATSTFTSVSTFAQVSLDDIIQHEVPRRKSHSPNIPRKFAMQPVLENEENEMDEEEELDKSKKFKIKPLTPNVRNKSNIIEHRRCSMEPIVENDENDFKEKDSLYVQDEQIDATKCTIEINNCPTKSNPKDDNKKLKEIAQRIKNNLKISTTKLVKPLDIKTNVAHSLGIFDGREQKTQNIQSGNPIPTKKNDRAKILRNKNTFNLAGDIEVQIKKALREWLTLETFIYIYGEEKVGEILTEKKLGDYYDQLKVSQLKRTQQQKYMDICKRLQLREMAESKFNMSCTGEQLQPLPDYKQLKQDGKEHDSKVKSFYQGMLYEADDSNFPLKKLEENTEEGAPAVLPLVDSVSQNALRRRIFLNSLNKGILQLLQLLQYNSLSVMTGVHSLVKTFKLRADNIIFKPMIWNYIALVTLKILALKDQELRTVLEERRYVEQVNLILDELPNKDQIITYSLNLLGNIDVFIEDFINSVDN